MNPKDFALERTDVLARIIPGLIILGCIFMLEKDILNGVTFDKINRTYPVMFVLFALVIAFALGDINTFLTFRIRWIIDKVFFSHLTLENFLLKNNWKKEDLSVFNDVKNIFFWDLHVRFRESFCESRKEGYKQAENQANKVRYTISFFLPTLFFGINSLSFELLESKSIIGVIGIFIAFLFYVNAEKRRRKEAHIIFINYYHHQNSKNTEKIANP